MTQRTVARARVVGLVLGLALAPWTAAGPAAAVEAGDGLQVDARVVGTVDGTVALNDVDDARPLHLDPDRDVRLELVVTNTQDEDLVVRTVRLEGRVLGMTFFDYASRVDRPIAAGDTEDLSLPLDVSELGEQATGLLPARLTLTSEDRRTLYEDPFAVEVEGSPWSTYGVFGVLVASVTVVLLAAALVRLALGALPRHRWLRAFRFAVPGLGLGLTLTFTLSVLDVLVPSDGSWVTIVVAGGLLGLLAGFATPSPDGVRRRADRGTDTDEPTTYQDEPPIAQQEQDEDRVIVLPDGATDDASTVPPSPRQPDEGDPRAEVDAELPPRPARRR